MEWSTRALSYATGDMLPVRKRRGFSGYARPNGPRSRLTGLPSPKDIQRRVFVAVQHQPAGAAYIGAHRQALDHPLRTAAPIGQHPATVLAGVLCGNTSLARRNLARRLLLLGRTQRSPVGGGQWGPVRRPWKPCERLYMETFQRSQTKTVIQPSTPYLKGRGLQLDVLINQADTAETR
jgi:hypothetical protein